MVAVDESGWPAPIPAPVPTTDVQARRFPFRPIQQANAPSPDATRHVVEYVTCGHQRLRRRVAYAGVSGPVGTTNLPDTTRFKPVVFKKSTQSAAAFTTTPSTSDNAVYMDEFAWALDQKFAGQGIFAAGAATPTSVQLDNEPELWSGTHLEIQGSTPISSDAYIIKTIVLTRALKDQFPGMTTVAAPARTSPGC